MSDLKKQLIKLGSTNPELRPHIRKILAAREVKMTKDDFYSSHESDFPGSAFTLENLTAKDGYALESKLDKKLPSGVEAEWLEESDIMEVRPKGAHDKEYNESSFKGWTSKHKNFKKIVETLLKGESERAI